MNPPQLRIYKADLHVHTVLSPCAGVEMIPPLIVETALEQQIEVIAICDHNASANVPAVQAAAKGTQLTVIPGMELQTREEIHLLCLFDAYETLSNFQKYVDEHLPEQENDPEFFGEQFVVDETGDFIRTESRLLLSSVNVSLEEACRQVRLLGGLPIPAHVDRKAFGLFAMLGFLPEELEFLAIEISAAITPAAAQIKYPQLRSRCLIQDGDVHYLSDFLGNTYFQIESPTLAEFELAFKHKNGRSVQILAKT